MDNVLSVAFCCFTEICVQTQADHFCFPQSVPSAEGRYMRMYHRLLFFYPPNTAADKPDHTT